MSEQTRRDRPDMPKGYGISTKDKGLMSWEWVEEQLAKSRNYWICSTRPDGRPHAAPVWGVWHEGALYFGSDPESRKGRNIAHNPEIAVHLESGDNAVMLEGRVVVENDAAALAPVQKAYAAKYAMPEGEPSPGYFVLRPRMALAWTEQDFPNTATRWKFDGNP
jgi:PPOX class probable F420-dependent enzyme